MAPTFGTVFQMAYAVEDFDTTLARHLAAGYEIACRGRVKVGGRAAYMGTVADLGHMLELVEGTGGTVEMFTMLEDAARPWHNKRPFSGAWETA